MTIYGLYIIGCIGSMVATWRSRVIRTGSFQGELGFLYRGSGVPFGLIEGRLKVGISMGDLEVQGNHNTTITLLIISQS